MVIPVFLIFLMLFSMSTWAAQVTDSPISYRIFPDRTDVLVHFSTDMDASTISKSTFTVNVVIPGVGSGTVAGKVQYENRTAAFISQSELIPGLTYSLSISPAVKDMEGNYLEPADEWRFIPQVHANVKPGFVKGEIIKKEYDGISNDLLTGGLGKSGLASGTAAPGYADPENPTAEGIRIKAICHNYKALQDSSEGGGYGVLYGPNINADGTASDDEGMVPGKEYLAYADGGTGMKNITMMVQIPDTFDPGNPCIVTAPSSGSRGIYGAIGTAGEWGLKRGCAVAYTDKGTGSGVHNLDTDTVNLITGVREDAETAGNNSNFTAQGTETADLESFKQEYPNRIAVKQAHSQQNCEKDWGRNVLDSIKFAFHILNLEENYGKPLEDEGTEMTITPENTIVIASSVSNGGGSSIRAAEQDTEGLIDGVAVTEPNVTPVPKESLAIRQGQKEWQYPNHSRPLLDYTTLLYLYQPCANLASENAGAPFNLNTGESSTNRCARLADMGMLTGETTEEQAIEAQKMINDYGIMEEQNFLMPSHDAANVPDSISFTYAASYGRFSVTDNLCGYSFGAVDDEGNLALMSETQASELFPVINAIPPASYIQLVNNNSLNGPVPTRNSVNDDGTMDQNLDGVLCLRRLATGMDVQGNPLEGEELEQHNRIMQGIDEIRASGNLHGLPVVYVTGRADAVLPPNHTSRAYFGVNRMIEGENSNLRYYEVPDAHHLDVFTELFPGFQEKYISLHYYLVSAEFLF